MKLPVLIEARQTRLSDPRAAERIARDLFGLDAVAMPLNGEFDDNFRLETHDHRRYALKIMRPACDQALIDLQIAALDRLRDLPVPRAVGFSGEFVHEYGGRLVWLLEWLPGELWADAKQRTPDMFSNLGRMLARVDRALENFDHPAAHRELKWDLARANWIRDYIPLIADSAKRALVESALRQFNALDLSRFRRGLIHGDANDHNILVDGANITGLIDFGDLHYGAPVFELAIACAYAAFGESDPLAAIRRIVRGYSEIYPLTDDESRALFSLILARLAVSVTNSAYLKNLDPESAYVTVSESQAWALLEKLSMLDPISAAFPDPAPILEGIDLRTEPCIVLDLSVGSLLLGADPGHTESAAMTDIVFAEMRKSGVKVAIGRYNEARAWYTTPEFAVNSGAHSCDEHRTIHIGLDLFAEPGTPVCAPVPGTVHAVANNAKRLDYGPVIVLRHLDRDNREFFTLYGHLSLDSLDHLRVGDDVSRGQRIGAIGAPPSNGDWAPHLHFQIITDLLGLATDFPGVAAASERERWLKLSPDPNLLIGIPADRFPKESPSRDDLLAARRASLGGNLSVSYAQPLSIVRGWRQYLYDETGRAFLDCYNNVPLVGHSHPRVVEAVQRQIALLNTNTRYLHQNIAEYAARLTALFPDPLRVCYFLNSASEANELAIRLARAHTGKEDVIVLDHAYHGNTNTLIDISPYKFNGPGGRGKKPWVHVAPQPDPLRRDDPQAGAEYAGAIAEILRTAKPAAFIAESLPSVGGQVVFPHGYLEAAYSHVHGASGVCIADEVQVGFGRLGQYFWGFEMQRVTPDIVVLGKPMGNGFPLAGVVTTREIADSFDNGMEFFSTYGGNPVACAAGLAVLDVLRDEKLRENARAVGDDWMAQIRAISREDSRVVDVRGSGLFLGVELTTGDLASTVVNQLRDRGILAGTDGPRHNVIKLRPPLIFSAADARFFCAVFGEILRGV